MVSPREWRLARVTCLVLLTRRVLKFRRRNPEGLCERIGIISLHMRSLWISDAGRVANLGWNAVFEFVYPWSCSNLIRTLRRGLLQVKKAL